MKGSLIMFLIAGLFLTGIACGGGGSSSTDTQDTGGVYGKGALIDSHTETVAGRVEFSITGSTTSDASMFWHEDNSSDDAILTFATYQATSIGSGMKIVFPVMGLKLLGSYHSQGLVLAVSFNQAPTGLSGTLDQLKCVRWRKPQGSFELLESDLAITSLDALEGWWWIDGNYYDESSKADRSLTDAIGTYNISMDGLFNYFSTSELDFAIVDTGDPNAESFGQQSSGETGEWWQQLQAANKSNWITPPQAPDGYTYVGMVVMIDKVTVYCDEDVMNHTDSSADSTKIYAASKTANATLDSDIVVGHIFKPTVTD